MGVWCVSKPIETVQLGSTGIDEHRLLNDLAELRRAIEVWARRRRLWSDAWFHVPFLHRDECPRYGDVLLLTYEGPLYNVFGQPEHPNAGRYYDEFSKLLEARGFEFESEDHISMSISPASDQRKAAFLSLYRLQWIQELAKKRLFDIHSEVFEHFAHSPDDLKQLSWRQYEELLNSIFRNQGFETQLGPGTNDGGIDIRLYQNQAIPQLVTLVQAKRYTHRPINLDAVAALFGVAVEQRASRGILATTSRFQPRAKKFALSTQTRVDIPSIELADATRVGGWCAEIARDLNNFFTSGMLAPPSVINRGLATGLAGKIVVARGGYNITENYFGVIEADFPYEVILRRIGSKITDGDVQIGHEIPDEEKQLHPGPFHQQRFVAFKNHSKYSNELYFWGDRKLFSVWDGSPQYFNNMD